MVRRRSSLLDLGITNASLLAFVFLNLLSLASTYPTKGEGSAVPPVRPLSSALKNVSTNLSIFPSPPVPPQCNLHFSYPSSRAATTSPNDKSSRLLFPRTPSICRLLQRWGPYRHPDPSVHLGIQTWYPGLHHVLSFISSTPLSSVWIFKYGGLTPQAYVYVASINHLQMQYAGPHGSKGTLHFVPPQDGEGRIGLSWYNYPLVPPDYGQRVRMELFVIDPSTGLGI